MRNGTMMKLFLPVLLLGLLLAPLPAAAQDTETGQEPDALSSDALDRLVGVRGDALNFDDVINTTADNPQRLNDYDLRWVNANRVGGQKAFPIVKDPYKNTVTVQKANLPWSSGYWPFVWCGLSFWRSGNPALSPLEKYDSFVLTTTGSNPRAAAWEANPANGHNEYSKAYEKPANTAEETKPREKMVKAAGANGQEIEVSGKVRYGWHGHCNGWAAAACLVPQPPAVTEVKLGTSLKTARLKYSSYAEAYDMAGDGDDQYQTGELRQQTLAFSRADLKGLLSESFMDCVANMTHPIVPNRYLERQGVRDRGYVYSGISLGNFKTPEEQQRAQDYLRQKGGEPFRDILPHNFHRICLDYLAQRNMAFVTEIDADNNKDNHPTYGYRYTQSYDEEKRQYDFEAVVTYATYAEYSFDGPNPLEARYTFSMKLDDRNRIVSSAWTGKSEFNHPDFLWVPIANAPAGNWENKNLDYDVIRNILKAGGVNDQDRPGTEGVEGSTGSGSSSGTGLPQPPVGGSPGRRSTTPASDFGSRRTTSADAEPGIRSDADGN